MFSKISSTIFLRVINAPTIGHHVNSKGVRLMSLNSINDPLMSNVDLLQRKERKRPSSVYNPAEATRLNIPTERKEFIALFPDVLQDISELVEKSFKDKDLIGRVIRSVKYNVPNGKQIFSMSLIVTYKQLVDPAQLTLENMKMIRLLGWILEMLVGTLLVADDIVDGGDVRRNQPCWYLLEDVKLRAVNDVLMIENLAYHLLKKHFSHLPCYPKLFEEFHKMYLTAINSWMLRFSEKVYNTLQWIIIENFVISKHLMHRAALHLHCIDNPELYHQTEPILNELGMYKQIQNDFGCLSDLVELRKTSSEIEEGQCNWLAIKCMEVATPAQREIMIKCYGKRDSEKAKLVKQLYEELQIPDLYYKYEKETYNKLALSIKNLSCGIPNEALFNILDMLFNRI